MAPGLWIRSFAVPLVLTAALWQAPQGPTGAAPEPGGSRASGVPGAGRVAPGPGQSPRPPATEHPATEHPAAKPPAPAGSDAVVGRAAVSGRPRGAGTLPLGVGLVLVGLGLGLLGLRLRWS
ncbi:hypothetical protein [Streptomyces sp. NPDC050560]|uniref:hypothetical protein n=1 Tax=Streptomyces sp. NPDC050560 TaxID=3365630 RepID=UPI0037B57B09